MPDDERDAASRAAAAKEAASTRTIRWRSAFRSEPLDPKRAKLVFWAWLRIVLGSMMLASGAVLIVEGRWGALAFVVFGAANIIHGLWQLPRAIRLTREYEAERGGRL